MCYEDSKMIKIATVACLEATFCPWSKVPKMEVFCPFKLKIMANFVFATNNSCWQWYQKSFEVSWNGVALVFLEP